MRLGGGRRYPPRMTTSQHAERMNWDAEEIRALIRGALEEDLGSVDVTTLALVPPSRSARARIVAKQDLVVAGLPLAERVFRNLDSEIRWEAAQAEGTDAAKGTAVALIEGRATTILSAERTALNFLAHLCGIATLTRQFVEAVAGTPARIRDTRKTTPFLRALEKYAVRMGGGTNHRFGLFDAVLIKENHIAIAGSVASAMQRARNFAAAYQPAQAEMTAYEAFRPPNAPPQLPVQIEVRNEAELREALAAGADAVLLDNVSPGQAAALVSLAHRERPACAIEVSGGISLTTVRAYAEAGVSFIAVGALTHSAPAADLSLLVEPPRGE